MGYVCASEKLLMKDGKYVFRGQPVPEADTWPLHILRANLRMGHIKEAPKGLGPSQPQTVTVQAKVAASPAVPASSSTDAVAAAGGSTDPSDEDPKPFAKRKGKR